MTLFAKNLNWWLQKADKEEWALPHLNISTSDQLLTIAKICLKNKSPIIIGLSEGEAAFMGYDLAVYLVQTIKKETNLAIFLNADHHRSLESAKKAIDAGFDSVNIDLSLKPDQENIAESRAVVDYAKRKNRQINIEGEIGALPTQSSEINKKDIKIDKNSLTTPQQAQQYVELAKVDRLSPAVGNLHGINKSGTNPKLNFERIDAIKKTVSVPLTLHGGSGIAKNEIKLSLQYFSNIHINTDLRIAYAKGVKKELKKTTTPYKYLAAGDRELAKAVEDKIKLFKSANKA